MSNYNLVIEGGNIANCAPDWEWRHHPGGNLLNLWFIYKGSGTLISNGISYKLSRGDCFLLRHSQSQYGKQDPKNDLIVPYILFVLLDKDGNPLDPDSVFPEASYHVEDPNLMYNIMKRCLDYYARSRLSESLHWLKTAILELNVANMSHYSGLQLEQYRKVTNICQHITDNPGHNWKISELARESSYTPDHFIRLFKQYTKTTPQSYIIKTRIQEAKSLLRFSEHSISRIADILGYSDEFCFSRQFKKHIGLSPSQYRTAKRNPTLR